MCIGNHKQCTHTHTPTHVDTRTHCDFTRVRDDFLSALLAWLLSLVSVSASDFYGSFVGGGSSAASAFELLSKMLSCGSFKEIR